MDKEKTLKNWLQITNLIFLVSQLIRAFTTIPIKWLTVFWTFIAVSYLIIGLKAIQWKSQKWAYRYLIPILGILLLYVCYYIYFNVGS